MNASSSRRDALDHAAGHLEGVRERLVRAMQASASAAGGAVTATAELDGHCRIAIGSDQAQAMDPADITAAVIAAHNRAHHLLAEQVVRAVPFLGDRPGAEAAP
ncbi:hypothetical protein [Glycomyces sp. MUSA5-2]|uniref:hypothetical protein n=1 Tax=Glycomyces sp. MUSA5-2 TaxID=2053002 RepID=UPI00300915E5